MKKLVVLLFCCISIQLSFGANLTVRLGNDTTFCSHNLEATSTDTAFIGSRLQLTGGVPPFRYQWSCNVRIGSAVYQANTFLNSDTIANPYFKDYFLDQTWEKFTLTVTDAHGQMASDSIRVRFSSWGIIPEPCTILKERNDSCRLPARCGVGGGIPPYNYNWTPSDALSDTTIEAPWCYTSEDRTYSVTIVDSCGCSVSSNIIVEIVTSDIRQNDYKEKDAYMKTGRIYLDSSYSNCQFFLFTTDGRLLYSGISDSEIDVSSCTQSHCNYIMLLKSQSGKHYLFKLFNP